ncbi:MAG: hypothetical protein F6J95_031315 [Leptolyngbya sp. SIO1E4]|nr:hypothetical protein [Leptolyngbya sp. SIO1E4]
MPDSIFTAVTFSPVTEFIEKTRKLRDLYGSSFILSHLATAVCLTAKQHLGKDAVISPAQLDVTLGTPDQIVIQGDFPENLAREAFLGAWGDIMDACKGWVDQNCQAWTQKALAGWARNGEWNRTWQQWKANAWEIFWVQADTISAVMDALAEAEANDRNWVGINWMGESSTLSGADAIAWPGLDRNIRAKERRMAEDQAHISDFFQELNLKIGAAILDDDLSNYRHNPKDLNDHLTELASRYSLNLQPYDSKALVKNSEFREELAKNLGEAIITNREQLSVPELTKRLFTLRTVAKAVPNSDQIRKELPKSFREVNLWKTDLPMGWFRGDGDEAGKHIRTITQREKPAQELRAFSWQMRQWGKFLKQSFDKRLGRVIIAGGDDFLGVFYPSEHPTEAIEWLCSFKEDVWHRGAEGQLDRKPITPSVGFVWASSQVPQRDILQHCELAEQRAKSSGRDRVCLRVLFASGTHVEWICPWWFLPKVVNGYRDRNGQQDWTHFYKDVAALKARHAFQGNPDIALALFNLFFTDPETGQKLLPEKSDVLFASSSPLWPQSGDTEELTGILQKDLRKMSVDKQQEAFNDWVISLANVGFQLFKQEMSISSDYPEAA